MKFYPMSLLLKKALKEGYAVPSFCVWNAETMLAVLKTAEKLEAPVIIMNGPGEYPLIGPILTGKIAGLFDNVRGYAALHLDHGDSVEIVNAALDAGYTSVMLDYSRRSFEENSSALKKVVEKAAPLGVTVEGEIGAVGKVNASVAEGSDFSTLTDPDQALEYVKITGVDALAVSIGNAHGNYTKLPEFRFDILEKIFEKVEIPLVLHGGSGTPEEDLKKAVSLGIAKVNVASELVRAVRNSLAAQWEDGSKPWLPSQMAEAIKDMEKVVEKWIVKLGAAGRM